MPQVRHGFKARHVFFAQNMDVFNKRREKEGREMVRGLICTVTAFTSFIGCFAAVALSNVKVQQRYPWNGKVDISFKFNSTRSNNTVRITAIDRSTGERLNVVNLFDENGTQLYAPIKMAPGEHRIVWDADKDLEAGFRTESLAVSVSVGKYFEYPTYCAIDISGGTDAEKWPVTYFDEMPAGGWPIEYKTTKLLFKLIQPGTFMMGPRPGTKHTNVIFENQHKVTITKPYYIGVFEISCFHYKLLQKKYSSGSALRGMWPIEYDDLRGTQKGRNWPSLEVDADSIIGVIRSKTGLTFLDLPSEAQWEYACRAGTTTDYNNGLNVGDGVEGGVNTDVGSLNPNAWGLYDFHSGAAEWSGDYFQQTLSDAIDPMIGVGTWDFHPIRGLGGDWPTGDVGGRNSSYRYFDNQAGGIATYCGARFVIFLEHNQE